MTLGMNAMPMNGLPSNYMNQQYWECLSKLIEQQQAQQAQQQSIYTQRQAQPQQQMPAQQAQQMLNSSTPIQNDWKANATPPSIKGDGKDDGSISFGKKIENMGKGVVNFFKGMVCDEKGNFSIKRTLTTAAVAAGAVALTVATGGAATPFLIAGGVAIAGVQTAKGAYNAATAKTDVEAETAWQDIGSGVTGIGLSVAGAKGSLKASGAITDANAAQYAGIKGAFKATGKTFTESGRMTKAGYQNLRADFKGTITNAKDVGIGNLKAKFNNDNASTLFKDNALGKIDKKISKIESKIEKLDVIKDADKIAKLQTELKINKFYKNQLVDKLGEIERLTPDNYKALIEQSKNKLTNYKEYIKNNPDKTKNAIRKEATAQLKEQIKTLEQYQKVAAAKYKIGNYENKKLVDLYNKDIKKLETQLKAETDAVKQVALKSEIAKLQNDIITFKATNNTDIPTFGEKTAFTRAKYITPGINELKTNQLWAGTAAANNIFTPGNQVQVQDQLAEQGFAEEQYAQLMQQLQNPDPNQLAAQYGAGGYPQPQQSYNQMAFNQMPPTGSPLGFEDLYQSPYPQMI